FYYFYFFFFFQAEDGIRDFHVTGVQTCALPIYNTFKENEIPLQISSPFIGLVKGSNQFINNTVNKVEVKCEYPINDSQTIHKLRSEERRVGKECRYRRSTYQ